MNFIVVARLKARPGRERQLETACRGMVADMRSEPNNLDVTLHHSLDDPATYTFYAVYTDRAAWDYHRATPHGASFAAALADILDTHSLELWEQLDRRQGRRQDASSNESRISGRKWGEGFLCMQATLFSLRFRRG